MTRAIQPFHRTRDGDALTEKVDNPNLGDIALGEVGADLAWDAVLGCVPSS